MGYLLPGAYLESKGAEAFAKAPIGSGPYKLKANNIGQSISFEAVEKHWFYGTPKYKGIELRNVPEATTRLALLQSGDVELAEITREQVPDLKKGGFNVFTKEGGNMAIVMPMEQWRPGNPLGVLKVRQALDLAIDRQTINDTFLKGLAKASVNYPIMSWDAAFEPIAVPKQDLARARQLLQESGHAGLQLDLISYSQPALPEGKEIMEAIGTWWESIGVRVNRTPVEYGSFFTKWGAGSDFGRPTVAGVQVVANRPVCAGVAIGPYTKESGFRLSEEPEMSQLARAYSNSTNMDDYVKNGRTFMKKAIEGSFIFGIAEVGETYAAKPAVVSEWKMGRGSYSVNLQGVAAGKI
jgi:ABC-type transport system substrate-binding protein